MNRQWYLLTREAETLFEWLAKKEPWRKSRYDFREVGEELGIERTETLLDHMGQLEKYTERAAGNYMVFKRDGIQGEYWVDIYPQARGAWAEYQREKRARMCPECAAPDCVEITVQWCPHCEKAFGLPEGKQGAK